jgi:hypothetical protein
MRPVRTFRFSTEVSGSGRSVQLRIERSVSGPAFRLSNGTFRFRIEVVSDPPNLLCPGRTFVFRTGVSGSGLKFSAAGRSFRQGTEVLVCGSSFLFPEPLLEFSMELSVSGLKLVGADRTFGARIGLSYFGRNCRCRIELWVSEPNVLFAERRSDFRMAVSRSGSKFSFPDSIFRFPLEVFVSGLNFSFAD